ncbi:MAG: CPBP family intramembrane metalloprotease [Acidobacteria bacterium]|nr:CPBP family intramembrane metalloprotease [Acidobacteriota bacterium]
MKMPMTTPQAPANNTQPSQRSNKGLFYQILVFSLDLVMAFVVGNVLMIPWLFGTLKEMRVVANSVQVTVEANQSPQGLAELKKAVSDLPGVKSTKVWTEGNKVIIDANGSRIPFERVLDLARQQGYKFVRAHTQGGGFLSERSLFMVILATQLGFFLVYFWHYRRRTAKSLRALFADSRGWRLVGWGLLAAAAVMSIGFAVDWIQVRAGVSPPQQALIRGALTGETWWLVSLGVLGVAILAPLAEEIFFRGYVFGTLLQYSKAPAYFISAAMFAVVHLEPAVMLPLFAVGLVLAYGYYRTGNLMVSVIAHAANNLVGVVLMYVKIGG